MNIALVESSRTVRGMLTQLLGARGHSVCGFGDPSAAIEKIASDQSIDGLITSAELSPISGQELCWESRLITKGRRPLYIMMMSSNLDEKFMIESLDMGADDIIAKPPSKGQLLARLRVGERNVVLQRELIRLAFTDPMTGLLNRRAFFERGTELCGVASETNPLAAILFDVDHFKEVNDLYGHQTGDMSIQTIAEMAKDGFPIVGRLGGDEICILVERCKLSEAWDLAEDLRSRIESLPITTPQGKAFMTCSLGVAAIGADSEIDDLIRSADLALYRAKLEGRNCVATPPPQSWIDENPRQTTSVVRQRKRKP